MSPQDDFGDSPRGFQRDLAAITLPAFVPLDPDDFGDSPRDMVLAKIREATHRERKQRSKEKRTRNNAARRAEHNNMARPEADGAPPPAQTAAAGAAEAPEGAARRGHQVSVRVQSLAGKVVHSSTPLSSDTVRDLKERLRAEAGVPLCRQQLLHGSTILEDAHRLGEIQAEDDDTITLLMIFAGQPVGDYCVFCDGNGKGALSLVCVWCKGSGDSTDSTAAAFADPAAALGRAQLHRDWDRVRRHRRRGVVQQRGPRW